jgi:NTP pyrophosphatase (non-canonical NTP hydrolase)
MPYEDLTWVKDLINNEQTTDVLMEVGQERARQDRKWGEQDHSPVEWVSILGEEYGEAAQAANEVYFIGEGKPAPRDLMNYREELLQVAAVAVAAVEDLDRKYPNLPKNGGK